MAANREYSSTDAKHGLPGFSSNSHWEEDAQDEGAFWSHHPVHLPPSSGKGFVDPIEAGPQCKQLWTDQNQPAAPDDNKSWNVDYREKGGIPVNDGLISQGSVFFGDGRDGDGAARGNSPMFKGGGPK